MCRKLGINRCCLEEDENEGGEKLIMLDKENLFTPQKNKGAATPLVGKELKFTPRLPLSNKKNESSAASTPEQCLTYSTTKRCNKNILESPEESPGGEEAEEEWTQDQTAGLVDETEPRVSSSSPVENRESIDTCSEEEDEIPFQSARKAVGQRRTAIESPDSVDCGFVSPRDAEHDTQLKSGSAAAVDELDSSAELDSSLQNLANAYKYNQGLSKIREGLMMLKEDGYNPAEVFMDMIKVGAQYAPLPEHLLASEHLTEDVIIKILSCSIENVQGIILQAGGPKDAAPPCEEEDSHLDPALNSFENEAKSSPVVESLDADQKQEENDTLLGDVGQNVGEESSIQEDSSHDIGEEENEAEPEAEAATEGLVSGDNENVVVDEEEQDDELPTLASDVQSAGNNELADTPEDSKQAQFDCDVQNDEPNGEGEICLSPEENYGDVKADVVVPESPRNFLKNVTVRSRRNSTFYMQSDSDSDMDIEDVSDKPYQLPIWAENTASAMAERGANDVKIKDDDSPGTSLFVDCEARNGNSKIESRAFSMPKPRSPSPAPSAVSVSSSRPSMSEDFVSAESHLSSSSNDDEDGSVHEVNEEVTSEKLPNGSTDVPSLPQTKETETLFQARVTDSPDSDMDIASSPQSTPCSGCSSPCRESKGGEEEAGTPQRKETKSWPKTPTTHATVLSEDMSCSSGESCITMSTAKPKRTERVLESDSEDEDIFESEAEPYSPGKEMLLSEDLDLGGNSCDRSYLALKKFQKEKEALVKELFAEYNAKIFQGKLPSDLQVKWNPSLQTTAGITKYSRKLAAGGKLEYSASVELSSKVVDCESRLKQTFCHELCHVAAWLINHVARPPHGKVFKYWADKAMSSFPDLNVSTCHTYDIHYKYQWQCCNDWCGRIYGRHSNSINTQKQACGICSGKLGFLGKFNADGTPCKTRAPSKFSLFVKENYNSAKLECGQQADHAAVMKHLSEKWKENQKKPSSSASTNGVKSLIAQFETLDPTR